MEGQSNLERILKICIAILGLAALVLAALIYVKSGYQIPWFDKKAPTVKVTAGNNNTTNSSQPNDPDLATPTANSTAEEQKQFFDHTVSVAKTATEVHLGASCATDPKVVKIFVKDGGLTFVNDDSVPHTIVFDSENNVELAPGARAKISAVFKRGGGIYGYGCDTSTSAVGIVYMAE